MAKLSYEDKKEIVRLYNDEHYGYRTISKKYNVRESTIKRIIRRFKIHGKSSLVKKKNKKFTPEIKLEIIKRSLEGESKWGLGVEYQVTEAQIISWLNKFEKFGYNGLIDKPKGKPPAMKKEKKSIDSNDKDAVIKSQADRILELEAEVEALKKLRALVLQRNKQQTEKKQ